MNVGAKIGGQAAVEATILRCRCGEPDSHAGAVCPQAVPEPLGMVAFEHHDWRVMLAYRLIIAAGYRCNLWVSKERDSNAIRRGR